MKTHIKLSLLLLALLLPDTATAHDIEVDGIYYNINGNEASVTYRGLSYSQFSNEYTGDIAIPTTVIYNNSTYNVTSIGQYAFCDCSDLISITMGNSVITIGSWAFYGCYSLTGIIIPSSVTSIGVGAFSDCSRLISISIPNSITLINDNMFSGCSSLTSVNIPNFVTSIGDWAFEGCSNLSSIIIPNSVISIGNGAFYNSAWFNNQPNGLVYAGLVAYKYKGIMPNKTSITIKDGTLGIADEAFENCSDLSSITIPNSVITIGDNAFSGCSCLTSITIPNSVTSIGDNSFSDCSGLISIIIPNSVTSIGEYAFSSCYNLISIIIGNSVTTIGCGAFLGCSCLTSITIPNSVTSIDWGTFLYCYNLTSITIPNSVTSISNSAFAGCDNLTSLFLKGEGDWTAGELPSTVTTLYIDNGITGVKGMNEKPVDVFSFAVRPPLTNENSFTDYSGTLHVPTASVAAYFTAPYWCNFNIVGDAIKLINFTLDKDSINMIFSDLSIIETLISPTSATLSNITWVSSNPAVATVVNGQVTAVGYGECDIVAMCLDQSAVCHVTVYNDCISVDQEQLQVQPNHIVSLMPTSLAPELPALIVTSSDPAVAAARVMNGKVQVVGVSEGTATITVSAADGTAKPATCLVTVYTEQGDTNGDGYIDIDDVTALIERVLGNEATSIKEKNADLNDDGIMDIDDVTALINTILGNN